MDSTTISPFNTVSDTVSNTMNSNSSITYTFVTYSLIVFIILILFYIFRSILMYNSYSEQFGNENTTNNNNTITRIWDNSMKFFNKK